MTHNRLWTAPTMFDLMQLLALCLVIAFLTGCGTLAKYQPNPVAHWETMKEKVMAETAIERRVEIQEAHRIVVAARVNGIHGIALDVGSALNPNSWKIFMADPLGHTFRAVVVAAEGVVAVKAGVKIYDKLNSKSSSKAASVGQGGTSIILKLEPGATATVNTGNTTTTTTTGVE